MLGFVPSCYVPTRKSLVISVVNKEIHMALDTRGCGSRSLLRSEEILEFPIPIAQRKDYSRAGNTDENSGKRKYYHNDDPRSLFFDPRAEAFVTERWI